MDTKQSKIIEQLFADENNYKNALSNINAALASECNKYKNFVEQLIEQNNKLKSALEGIVDMLHANRDPYDDEGLYSTGGGYRWDWQPIDEAHNVLLRPPVERRPRK